jgi:hypothetical protein
VGESSARKRARARERERESESEREDRQGCLRKGASVTAAVVSEFGFSKAKIVRRARRLFVGFSTGTKYLPVALTPHAKENKPPP